MLFSKSFSCFVIAAVVLFSANTIIGAREKNQTDAGKPRNADTFNAYRELEYARVGDASLLMDIYVPKSAAKPVPVIIWVHGGGWRMGTRAGKEPLGYGFIEKGYALACIDYRLTDKANFPAQIYDCKAAVRFLRGNAQKYNLDPNRFGALGVSAGGHLVALLGTTSDTKVLDGNEGNYLKESSAVQAVFDFCGPADLTTIAGPSGKPALANENSIVSRLVGGPVLEKLDIAAKASPVTYITKNDPPFFIMHGDADTQVPVSQSRQFYDALKKAGVKAELKIIEGAPHGLPVWRDDPNLIGDVRAFFDKTLK